MDPTQGRRHLPEAFEGAYRVGPGVGCDWLQLQSLVVAAERAASNDKAIALYREALSLERGEPFAHVSPGTFRVCAVWTFTWAWTGLLVHNMERAIADAAHHLAEQGAASRRRRDGLLGRSSGPAGHPRPAVAVRDRERAAAARRDVDGVKRGYLGAHTGPP